ncbi:uncharacterized protein LOC124701165 [Lolium rigidum]|uniref:uncharacterized protein LOC124701165 n=1 Tax=Lolium rigidum TaxID=89674 RepID=UPI001F5CE270|nr:uncharacterized protein LOC124701165 [Lolium rigidum]
MPRRPGRRSRSEPRWSLSEPPPGLFPAGGEDLLRFLAVLAIAAGVAAACSLFNRRPNPNPNPLCDSDSPYADYDSCEPCPENGRCVDGKMMECVQGFKKYGNTCVEDGRLTRTANNIAELLHRRVCDDHARALCGHTGKISFKQLDISNMADELLSNHPARLTAAGIQVVKDRALQSVRAFLETTSTDNEAQAFKCPDLVAQLHRPLHCQVRQWIAGNVVFVVTFAILFAALLTLLWSVYKRRALSKRAEQIYEQVCEILEETAINAKIGISKCEPWVVTSWLRDHLLVTRERRNASLWKKVEELILEDSRIDQYPKVIKGESKVVLEWQASGSLSGKIKKMQGAPRGKTMSSSSVGAIRLAEEICGSSSKDKEEERSARKEGTNAFIM